MNKFLRLTMAAALALVSTITFAQTTVTFTAGTDKGPDGGTPGNDVSITKDGITINAKGTGTGNGGVLGRTDNYRFYQGATVTISSTVGNITKVVLTCTANGTTKYGPGCFTDASTGTYTTAGKEGTWTGNAASFSLTSSSAQVRATKIEVTYTAGGSTPTGLSKPTITGTTPFTESTTVTITADEGATIYYTTNGQDPDDREGTEYTAPFTLTQTTTVKAIAFKGDLTSDIETKDFVKQENVTTTGNGTVESPYTVADAIAMNAAKALPSDTAYYTGVIKYIKNVDTGAYGNAEYSIAASTSAADTLLVYRGYFLQGHKFTAKDQIKVGDNVVVKGKLIFYNEQTLELGTRNYIYSLNGKTTDDTKVTPKDTASYTVAQALAVLKAGTATTDVVYVTGKVSKIKEISTQFGNATFNISDDGANIDTLYVFRGKYLNNAKFTAEDQLKVGDEVKIAGVLENYTKSDVTTPQLVNSWLVSVKSAETPITPSATAANIAAFKALENNTDAVLTLKDAQVLYSWTSNNNHNSTYVRDATGALLLYDAGLGLEANKVVNGTVNLTRTAYNDQVQAKKNDKTNADNLTVTDGEATPKTITLAQASQNVSDLVVVENVNIVAKGMKFYAVSGTDSLQVFNGFHLDGCTPAAAENVNIKGIIAQYKQTYEIYPIEAPTVATGIETIKTDGAKALDLNAPLYNIAGQRVSRSYKGVVIQNGKKYILK